MDNNTVRNFAQALKTFDTDVTAQEAEEKILSVLNKLDDEEILSYEEAAKKIATLQEAEDNVKKSVKELFAELFPSLSFYPALGIWGLVDKMIQTGTISGLDTADRDKLLVYSALFFGLVGGKIAYNRIKEKVNEIKSADAQISEVLKHAGIQINETEDVEKHTVRDGVQAIASEKGLSNHEAMIQYAEQNNIDFGDVYDMYVYGDDDMSLEDAKRALKRTEEEFEREQYADDFLYSNGGWNRYENKIRYLKRLIKRLEGKESIQESYNSEIRTLLGKGKIDRELAEQPWAKNPPEINNNEWSLVSYKNFDIIVYHYNESDDDEDEKFEVEIYPKGEADDTMPPIDYMNSHNWLKCLEKIAEVANKNKKENDTIEPEDDGSEYNEIPDDVHEIVSSIYN